MPDLVAFRRSGRRQRVRVDRRLGRSDVWVIRERTRPVPPLALADGSPIVMLDDISRQVVLRCERLVSPLCAYGPLEDLGFEWREGCRYDRRVADYWAAMRVAWQLDAARVCERLEIYPMLTLLTRRPVARVRRARLERAVQLIVLLGLVWRAMGDDALFGPLCWMEADVLVEEGSDFYERYA